MANTNRQPRRRAATQESPRDELEDLRVAFNVRMEGDLAYFLDAIAALANPEVKAAPMFDELHSRAHRLAGGAAIFEVAAIASAASALVRAAAAASMARATRADAAVTGALADLVRILAIHTGYASGR